MANGVNPNVRPAGPKPRKSNAPAILGALSVLFLGTTGYFYSQVSSGKAVVGELQEGLVSISKAAESDVYTLEKAAIATNQAQLLTGLAEVVANRKIDVEIARTEATREKDAAAKASSERDAATTQLAEARRQLDASRQETAKAKTDLAALQKKYDSDMAVLNAKVEALEGGVVVEVDASSAPAAEPATPVAETTEQESAVPAEPVVAEDGSTVVPEGGSQLFKTVRYEGASSTLTFVTVTDEKLVYSSVPGDVYQRLVAAPVMDLFFRFQIMEKYPSTPKDVDLIQAVTAADRD